MKPEDYKLFTSDGEKHPTIGLCPFCSAPGWITGDDEWCEHYIGTCDSKSAAGPLGISVFPRINDLEISKTWLQKMEELQGLPREELERRFLNIPVELKEFAINSIENEWMPSAFLDFYGKFEYLECPADGALWTDNCVSFFAEDFCKVEKNFSEILSKIMEMSNTNNM